MPDFRIVVNGSETTLKDISGDLVEKTEDLPEVGQVVLSFILSQEKIKVGESGIVIKIDGKPIGEPSYFGLEDQEDIPKELLNAFMGKLR